MTAFGVARNFDVGAAPHLCPCLTAATPSWSEPHLRFPSDGRPWCGVDDQFVVRQSLDSEDVGAAFRRPRDQWNSVEQQ